MQFIKIARNIVSRVKTLTCSKRKPIYQSEQDMDFCGNLRTTHVYYAYFRKLFGCYADGLKNTRVLCANFQKHDQKIH